MTTIGNNYASSPSFTGTAAKTAGSDMLNQASFLKLMTAQLKMQDPFSPMDNSQMVAQMATFSQVAGTTEMNQSLAGIKSLLGGMSNSLSTSRIPDAANWIGKSMLVSGDIATPDRFGVYGGEIKLASDTDDMAIDLVDAKGNVVKTIDIGHKAEGETVAFYWDGTGADGNAIDSQALQVVVRGATPSNISTWAAIAGVQSPADASSAKLITAIGEFSPSDAKKLS